MGDRTGVHRSLAMYGKNRVFTVFVWENASQCGRSNRDQDVGFENTSRARCSRCDACAPKECYVQKKGDRYLEVDPWRIVEQGFHEEQGRVSESLFCLSNENIGF